jgi:hypothetical protein
MLRTLLFFLLGYIAWTVFRLMQRINRQRRTTMQDYNTVQSTGNGKKPKAESPEIRDAEFEDIDPKKSDDA